MAATAEKKQGGILLVDTTKDEQPPRAPKKKLLEILADRYSVAPDIFERTVSAVAMPNPHTREELISCLIVANEHDLNPLTKEIHFMRTKTGQIVPIVGVDGWVKKLNGHPQFNGFEFEHEWSEAKDGAKKLVAVTCKIYRKDRDYPIVATELMSECARLPGPGKGPNAWSMTPSRMLRHRALMQATRYAVGFGGVMDMDEFERWQEMKDITPRQQQPALAVPDDIPDEIVSEAEADQDSPLVDQAGYLRHLDEELSIASDLEIFQEIWDAHAVSSDGRLSRESQEAAQALHDKYAKRFGTAE